MSAESVEVQVRPGVEADLTSLTDIYNHYIRETPITFDTAVFTPEERRPWLLSHLEDGPHRLMVAVSSDHEGDTAARSAALGAGVGRRVGGFLDTPRAARFARSRRTTPPSRCRFRYVGTYREVGRKFGRYWDVAWYEKEL